MTIVSDTRRRASRRRTTGSRHSVRPRRIAFRFDNPPMKRHYADGDIAFSHLVAVLSGAFPPGEEFFVSSVRRLASEVTDADLAEAVKGFVGQEVSHGREHRGLNDSLAELGYPVKLIDRGGKMLLPLVNRLLPPSLPLAFTAAAEHYTATLAERVLESEELQAIMTDDEVKKLLMWHAIEELEHKSVAFDVYRATGGSEAVRIATMAAMLVATIPVVAVGVVLSMATDPAALHPIRTARSAVGIFTSPLLRDDVIPTLFKYLRPGFHPNDIDTAELLARSREEAFGADGELVGNLR